MNQTTFSLSVSAARTALFKVSAVKSQNVSFATSGRHCLFLFAVCGAILALAAPTAQSQSPLGLSITNGVLMKDGRPYHGIGVNYFDAFYRNILNRSDTSYVRGFDTLQQHDIPFVRFSLTGYWPSHFALYNTNKPEFYRRLDAFVGQAAIHNVGLIPSFFWTNFMVPDIVGEPVNSWGNPDSRTRQFMRSFTAEVVERYKDSPAIWGWEFGNEFNLGSDLPNAADWRPPIQPTLGTPTSRSASDDIRGDMIHSAMADFGTVVRRHDPARVISTGNSFMRPSAWNQYTSLSWTTDTPEQSAMIYDLLTPDPMNLVSGHAYDTTGWDTLLEYSAAQGKVAFFGEFGVPGDDDAAKAAFHDMLQQIKDDGVPLAAVWNFDRTSADEWSISSLPNGRRSWQLDEMQRFNQVPEPSFWALLVTGAAVPFAFGLRKSKVATEQNHRILIAGGRMGCPSY